VSTERPRDSRERSSGASWTCNALAIDCASITGCIGVGSVNVQEGGGVDSVSFLNQTTECIDFDANEKTGATGISNPFIRNVDCLFITTNTSNAIGIYINAQDGPAEISNTTVAVPGSQSTSPIILDCLDLDGGRGTNINYFHCEHATNAEVIGDTNLVHNVTVNGLTASATSLGVWLKNNQDYDITVESVELETATPMTGALTDAINLITVPASHIAQYVIGNGTFYASDVTIASFPGQFQQLRLASFTLYQLNLPLISLPAGSVAFCSDCRPASGTAVCSSGGAGALALRIGLSGWYCK